MNITEAYAQIWQNKGMVSPELHVDRVAWTTELFPLIQGAVLVDLGTGSGRMLVEAKNRRWTGIGYEFNSEVCQHLRALGYFVREADLSVDQLECASADIVTCCDVIEHLIDPLHAMTEAFKILKPGGLCLVATPNISCWRRIAIMIGGNHPRTSGDHVLYDGGHVGYYGPRDLIGILEQAGFQKVEIQYFNSDPVPDEWRHLGDKEWLDYTYMIASAVKP